MERQKLSRRDAKKVVQGRAELYYYYTTVQDKSGSTIPQMRVRVRHQV